MSPHQDAASPGDRFVRANGVNVHYEVHCQGEPLLLLHGGSLSGEMWQPPNAELAIVPGAGHGAFVAEKAPIFQSLILDFLQRHGGSPAQQLRDATRR